jgi:DNA (cytosine-5)-methyltransferase 1
MFQDVVIRKIGDSKGTPRVYLDMPELQRAKFTAGANYKLTIDETGKRVVLLVDKDGDRVVSSKAKGEVRTPVVDLQSFRVLRIFEGFDRVRIIFMAGRIFVLPLASQLAQHERRERILGKLQRGESLAVASLCFGAGLMNYAAHEGLKAGGVPAHTSVVNEIDETYANHSRSANPVWNDETVGLIAPMQELFQDEWVFSRLKRCEIVEFGIPCSGASKAGVSKRKLSVMEEHPLVGHLLMPALAIVQKLQPAVICIECVTGYAKTGSSHIARSMLRDMGYQVVEVVLNAADFSCLENRERWFLVATTNGITIDLADLKPVLTRQSCVGDVLEYVAEDDPRWSPLTYLVDKATRDSEQGKGFQMQTVNAASTKVPVLRKSYFKGGSTDPYIEHPSKKGLLRKFSGLEHARIKGYPESIVAGVSETTKHEILGQGVAKQPVKALFKRIGECLQQAAMVAKSGTVASASQSTYSLKGTG